jgi:nucleoside-diphosphate-sugar epimerase
MGLQKARKGVIGEKTMKVLLTGGSGNLGQTLVAKLLDKGDTPVILDIRAPRSALNERAVFIEGSVLDRAKLTEIFGGCECLVHIAAWHGIHEDRGEKDAYYFFDLNVRGTFEVFQAAASAGIGKVIFISTTSVYRPNTRYGSSKILAELIAEDYRKHHLMNVVTLRPRGFIPYWDRAVYAKYSDWARWFWKGAVHIDDFATAVILSLDLLSGGNSTGSSFSPSTAPMNTPTPILIIGMSRNRPRPSGNTIPNITIWRSLTGSIRH